METPVANLGISIVIAPVMYVPYNLVVECTFYMHFHSDNYYGYIMLRTNTAPDSDIFATRNAYNSFSLQNYHCTEPEL